MIYFSRSAQLDVRLMQCGFNATLALSMAISIHIGWLGLKANKHHTLGLLSLVVGLQASCNERGYLFVYVSSLLFAYKSNSF